MDPRDHQLFKQYPIQKTVHISSGVVPTPYHIYDGYGLFIGGTGNLEAIKHLLRNEDVIPVQTSDAKALMGIWICNFTDASLNSHHELQFSFFVSRQEIAPIPPHPFNTLALTLMRKDVQMLCLGLWNNTANVVAYNRELLSLDARQADSKIERQRNSINFQFEDTDSKERIISGSIKNPMVSSLKATISFMSRLGFRQGLALARQPWISMEIVNPRGVAWDTNAVARTFTKNDRNGIRFYEHANDLNIGNPAFQTVGFTPQVVQSMDGFKFVYLQPE